MIIRSTCYLLITLTICLWSCDTPEPEPTALVLEELTDLPVELDEASGLILAANGNVIAHNDKGDYLYEFDFSGNLVKTIEIKNASNVDWEDMATDSNGDIYLSDTGNNDNDRDDLAIYKISAVAYTAATTSVPATIQEFAYEDQTAFPPGPDDRHFDCEALVIVNNIPCLFTRDRTNPFQGITRYYQAIGAEATFQSTFNTDDRGSFGAITGAAMNPAGTQLALVSNRKCWLINGFSGTNFFSGTITSYDFDKDLQIEGVVYQDNCTLLLVDEKNGTTSGKLFRTNICI